MERFTFGELCGTVGKSPVVVKNLQRSLGLPVPRNGEGYSEGYVHFFEKVVSLRAFSVPTEKIRALLELEKKILCMLHIDSLSESDNWFLDSCRSSAPSAQSLLLTGFDLGFAISEDEAAPVQHHLDFKPRDPELFSGREMGEDVRVVLRRYSGMVEEIRAKVDAETPVLREALAWAGGAFGTMRRPAASSPPDRQRT